MLYALHHGNAMESGALSWEKDVKGFKKYLQGTNHSGNEKKTMLNRMKMYDIVGNNQHHVGNGVTKNKIKSCSNRYGAIETSNFERKEINLQQFIDARALKLVTLG